MARVQKYALVIDGPKHPEFNKEQLVKETERIRDLIYARFGERIEIAKPSVNLEEKKIDFTVETSSITAQEAQEIVDYVAGYQKCTMLFSKTNIHEMALKGDVHGLIRALEQCDDYDIVTQGIQALADFPDSPQAIDMLIRLSRRAHNVYREYEIGALGRIGGEKVSIALLPLLDDPEFSIRQKAIATLGKCRARAAVPRLIQSLQEDTDECTHAGMALAQIGDASAIPAIKKRLKHERSKYRRLCFKRAINALRTKK